MYGDWRVGCMDREKNACLLLGLNYFDSDDLLKENLFDQRLAFSSLRFDRYGHSFIRLETASRVYSSPNELVTRYRNCSSSARAATDFDFNLSFLATSFHLNTEFVCSVLPDGDLLTEGRE